MREVKYIDVGKLSMKEARKVLSAVKKDMVYAPYLPLVPSTHVEDKWSCGYCDTLNETLNKRCCECGAPRSSR